MVARDAEDTRRRLVAAAVEEFAAHGLAGGRVDRIAAGASANKRAIYDYFGSKEGLFDAAVTRVISDLLDDVPLVEEDLPGYTVAFFDYLLLHPEAVRIIRWCQLERPEAGPRPTDAFLEHMAAIPTTPHGRRSTARAGGGPIRPVDLVVLLLGLANAWSLLASSLLPPAGEDPEDPARVAEHRRSLVEAARRISAPQ